MAYREKYITGQETIKVAGWNLTKTTYLLPEDVKRVIFNDKNWEVKLVGVEWGAPELRLDPLDDTHVRLLHDNDKGFSADVHSGHDLSTMAIDIAEAEVALVWAKELFSDWETYFAYQL